MSAVTGEFTIRDRNLVGVIAAMGLAIVLGLAIVGSGATALVGLLGIVAFGFFVRFPTLGLYITSALLLVSGSAGIIGSVRVAVPITAAKICGAATFLAWLSNLIVRRQRFRLNWELSLLILFFVWTAIGVFASPTWEEQWPEWFRLGTLVAYFVLAVHLLDTSKRVHTYIVMILICGVAMAVFAVVQYFTPGLHLDVDTAVADMASRTEGAYVELEPLRSGPAVRVSGGAGHSNWLSMIILLILPLNAYWYARSQTWRGKAFALAAVALEIIALVLTFTRAGFLVGITILALLGARNLLRWTPHRMAAAALAVYLAWFFLPQAYKERVLAVDQYTSSDSVRHRMELQRSALELTKNRPLWGWGLGGYGLRLLEERTEVAGIMRWIVEEYDWSPLSIGTHNLYLQLLCETGVVGLSLILVFFWILIRDLRRASRRFREAGDTHMVALSAALEVSLWSFLVCGLFLHALQQKLWWMMAAIATVVPLYRISALEVSAQRRHSTETVEQ